MITDDEMKRLAFYIAVAVSHVFQGSPKTFEEIFPNTVINTKSDREWDVERPAFLTDKTPTEIKRIQLDASKCDVEQLEKLIDKIVTKKMNVGRR